MDMITMKRFMDKLIEATANGVVCWHSVNGGYQCLHKFKQMTLIQRSKDIEFTLVGTTGGNLMLTSFGSYPVKELFEAATMNATNTDKMLEEMFSDNLFMENKAV